MGLDMSDTQWALSQQMRWKEAVEEKRGTKADLSDACLGCLHWLSLAMHKRREAISGQTPGRDPVLTLPILHPFDTQRPEGSFEKANQMLLLCFKALPFHFS